MRRTALTAENAESVSMRMEAEGWYAFVKLFSTAMDITAIGAKVFYFGQFGDDQRYSGINLATEARQRIK